jgi:hypothetical protein
MRPPQPVDGREPMAWGPVMAPTRHPIHREDRIWGQTNCYCDLWIELLHAMGHEPIAALPFTFAIDFEGDQWTFFKFPAADLATLYGADVQELALWRPLLDHVEEQIARRRIVLVEVDSFHLPDTEGTAYKRQHTKTTIAIAAVDRQGQRLDYFHNSGFYSLQGADFQGIISGPAESDLPHLPPYAEFVKFGFAKPLPEAELLALSLDILRLRLRQVPAANPFREFKARFERDSATLLGMPLDHFHQYAFATMRQFGACYELSGTYLGWLSGHGIPGYSETAGQFLDLANGAKVLQFQLARSVSKRKAMDLTALDSMAVAWDRGMERLRAALG